MQLEIYIKDLLYRYDCVVVPNLGAFLTQRVSAKIHNSTHTLYPPKKLLSFNEQLQKNDGLLANYIAEVEKIPYNKAIHKIAKQVKSIKSYLIEGETIQFEHIGDLMLNTDSNIVFEPSNHINFLTDSFGLSHFNSAEVSRDAYKKDIEVFEEKVPLVITQEKRSGSWLKYAAAAVIILSLGGFGGYQYYSNSIESHNQIAQEEANAQLDEKVQEATFVISNPLPAITLNVEKQTGNYHVVAGAFRIQSNSVKKVNQLRTKGYKARVIGKNRYGLHEVVYSSFETRDEATKALYKIRREHNRDAWLLVKKLD
ncbi:SPOR domain-containing protein [Winogradskyella sp. DF17]|uniref:SPOR domain-containing protein n=1 Tax=Winogradskyella pelagia TaxID=2819984 RepID=A0ABS3SZU6_9FLAO|nr:SPOR domain-containing protein [Winogradskyella sp. DF17]MBO3115181.1 SPOR domain-containing protein [Winogradskyella sp. DF17]